MWYYQWVDWKLGISIQVIKEGKKKREFVISPSEQVHGLFLVWIIALDFTPSLSLSSHKWPGTREIRNENENTM